MTYGTIYYGEGVMLAVRTVMEAVSEMLAALAEVTVLPEFAFSEATAVEEAASPMSVFLDEQSYHAKVMAAADAVSLQEALESQMIETGWRPVGSGAAGPALWGRYTLEREGSTWEAVSLIVPGELPGTYFVSVQAYRDAAGE
ncbi:hypothetical protein ACVNPS_04640 [Candidatus Bipolaricaulota sp. J31]